MKISFETEKLWLAKLWRDIKNLWHKEQPVIYVTAKEYLEICRDDVHNLLGRYDVKIKQDLEVVEKVVIKEITSMGFISAMEKIGKDIEKGLVFVLKYAIPIETIVKLLFPTIPAVGAATTAVFNVAQLIQNAVITVEQKYAALNTTGITGAQKLADVIAITEPVVISGLAQAGIVADSSYVESLVNAVVALLNIPTSVTVTAVSVANVPTSVVSVASPAPTAVAALVQDGVVKA